MNDYSPKYRLMLKCKINTKLSNLFTVSDSQVTLRKTENYYLLLEQKHDDAGPFQCCSGVGSPVFVLLLSVIKETALA